MPAKKEIILGVCGSIAAYKAGEIIRRLKGQGFKVTVIMTKEAEEFITPLTLQALSQNRVYRGMFDLSEEEFDPEHISLAERADLILVAPATANVIGKIAAGICDDLLTSVIMAAPGKILLAPAMNQGMWKNKILQQNLSGLKKLGYKFVEPEKGSLADGKTGVGRLAAVEKIIAAVKQNL